MFNPYGVQRSDRGGDSNFGWVHQPIFGPLGENGSPGGSHDTFRVDTMGNISHLHTTVQVGNREMGLRKIGLYP